MIRHPALRKIIGANPLGSIAATNQAFTGGRFFGMSRPPPLIFDARHQHAHGLIPVLVLRTSILTLDDRTGWQVRNTHRRISLVNVLAARARGAEGINA